MWILFHSKGKSFCLLPGKQYVIGRKNADLVLEGDQSVSRKHAVLSVSANTNLDINTSPSTLKLVDENSKYGTYVKNSDNWNQIQHIEEHVLVDKDTIRFGLLENEWRVMYVPLIVTMSNLNNEEKLQLRSTLLRIDGYMTKTWVSSSTHLTMKGITLTIKAICALACGKPIVTPEYWSTYFEMAANNKELPDCNEFIPPLKEPAIDANSVSLGVIDERQSVFRGKHFVFASQIDLKELGCMVAAAGGTAAAFDKYVNSFDQLCLPDVILVSCSFITSRSAPTQQVHLIEPFNNAERYLQSRGRRVIADEEIGYAILYCSTEKYCNPQQNLSDTVSSSPNMSQVHGSKVSLDFTSQTVNKPTQEIDSTPCILHPVMEPTNKQPIVQRAGSQHLNMHSDDSTFVHSITQTSCASSIDIFASPVKVERTSEKETAKPYDNRKRIRTPELDNAPALKRPAHVNNVTSRNVPIKLESENLFSLSTDNPRPKRFRPDDSEEEDEFTFSNKTKPKRERLTRLNESSGDLFGSMPNTLVESNHTQQQHGLLQAHSSMRPLPDTPREKVVPTLRSSEPAVVPQKGNLSLKKSIPSFDTTTRTTSFVSKIPVSLQGFLNTTCVKTDHHELDDLVDSVKDIFLIKEKLLVVREKTRLTSSVNDTTNVSLPGTAKNFKRFQKILPINQRILPRIIGGKDLYVYKGEIENKWDVTLDDSREDANLEMEKEKDEWSFPTPGKSVNTTIKTKSRK